MDGNRKQRLVITGMLKACGVEAARARGQADEDVGLVMSNGRRSKSFCRLHG